jgi:iron complex transport system substrate-binding protein
VAAFFDKETQADSVFNQIEKSYLNTIALVSDKEPKPTVMSGIVYGDTWFLPGGQNYAARLFIDAGFTYLWSENQNNAFLELSFESVYEKAHTADFWIGVGSYTSLKELTETDQRYTRFDAVRNHKVYTYDYRKGATGGSEFLELGYLRPDMIIKDLVKIAYPELLPDYSLYFHRKLE